MISQIITTLIVSLSLLYTQHEPVDPSHKRFCHNMQTESIITPNKIGPGMLPKARITSHCIPKANDRNLDGTTLKNITLNLVKEIAEQKLNFIR